MKTAKHIVVGSIVGVSLLLMSISAWADEKSTPQDLIIKSIGVIERFSKDENMSYFRTVVKDAKAVFIVPRMLKGGFVVGGSGGNGVLMAYDEETTSWGYPVFYSMGSVSLGLQAGVESSEIILLVMTKKGVDSLLGTSLKLGADATAAAGPYGGGAKAATTDILAYSISKGAYGGLSVEGAKITSKDDWNELYYGKPTTAADIIIKKSMVNREADSLRQAVAEITGK